MFEFIDKLEVKTIPEQIADRFRDEIFTGKLKAGDKLPALEELSLRLGVSKPTVREGLQILYKSGLVSIIQGRNGGYFITEFQPEKLMQSMYEMITFSLKFNYLERRHLLEIRKMIEVPCAGIAAERRTEKNLDKLRSIINIINSDIEYEIQELMQIDLEFHLAIAECTQNPMAKTIINAITKSFLESNMNWNDKNKKMITANAENIVEAISTKDSKTAREEMEKHIINFL